MPVLEVVPVDRRHKRSIFLNKFAENVYSAQGEDGLIDVSFRIMGTKNKWCVEFGAWDGKHLSDTRNLLVHKDWSGVLIEGNTYKGGQLKETYKDNPKVFPIVSVVAYDKGVNMLDDLLATTPIPRNPDLMVIDIDGNDYHVWESVTEFRPRMVIIEFNPTIPNDVVFIQDRDVTVNEGCSLLAATRLAKTKGYELAIVHGQNAYFVVKEEFVKFGIEDNSVDAFRVDVPNRIFCGYNAKIYQTFKKFQWKGRGIELKPDSLQYFSAEELKYDYGIPEKDLKSLKNS